MGVTAGLEDGLSFQPKLVSPLTIKLRAVLFSWPNLAHTEVSGDFTGSNAVSFVASHNDNVCSASSQDHDETPEKYCFLPIVSQNQFYFSLSLSFSKKYSVRESLTQMNKREEMEKGG